MQYFTNHGASAFAAILVFSAASIFLISAVMVIANTSKSEVTYTDYLGDSLGWLFNKIVIPFICFLSVGVLLSGAGTIATNYFGISQWLGVGVMTVCLVATYLGGVNKMIDILGVAGPVLIAFTFIVCIAAILQGDFTNAYEVIESTPGKLVISDYFWWGAIQYAAFQPGVQLLFINQMGRRANNTAEAIGGAVVGNLLIISAFVLLSVAFLGNYASLVGIDVPTLELAVRLSPVLGIVYGINIVIALYTTIMPSYWILCTSMPTSRNRKTDVIFAVSVAVVFLFGGQLPFGKMMNIAWPIIGYISTIFAVFVVIKAVRMLMGKKSGEASAP